MPPIFCIALYLANKQANTGIQTNTCTHNGKHTLYLQTRNVSNAKCHVLTPRSMEDHSLDDHCGSRLVPSQPRALARRRILACWSQDTRVGWTCLGTTLCDSPAGALGQVWPVYNILLCLVAHISSSCLWLVLGCSIWLGLGLDFGLCTWVPATLPWLWPLDLALAFAHDPPPDVRSWAWPCRWGCPFRWAWTWRGAWPTIPWAQPGWPCDAHSNLRLGLVGIVLHGNPGVPIVICEMLSIICLNLTHACGVPAHWHGLSLLRVMQHKGQRLVVMAVSLCLLQHMHSNVHKHLCHFAAINHHAFQLWATLTRTCPWLKNVQAMNVDLAAGVEGGLPGESLTTLK